MQENVKQVIVKMTARRCFRTEPIWQYDGGHVLTFEGFDLPMSFEVHFSRSPMGNAIPQIGTNGVCTVPEMFTQNAGVIYAWLYIADVDSRLTKYSIEIPVAKRAKPTNQEPTPVEQSAIDQAIAALNAGVEAAEDAQEAAEAAQASAESYAESAGQSAITSTNAATAAATSEGNAASSATAAASSATDANASRQAADLSATNAGVSERNAAASATAAAGSATSAAASAGQASGSATAASGSASTASTKASEAAQSATAAAGSAASASEDAGTASTAATAAGQSATAAAGSATAAAGSATSAGQSATAAAGSAAAAQEVLESIPEDYSDLSDDVDSLKSALNNKIDNKIKSVLPKNCDFMDLTFGESKTENKLNPYLIIEDTGVDGSGNVVDTEGYFTTPFIPISKRYINAIRVLNDDTTSKKARVAVYDSSKTFLGRTGINDNTPVDSNNYQGAAYVIVQFNRQDFLAIKYPFVGFSDDSALMTPVEFDADVTSAVINENYLPDSPIPPTPSNTVDLFLFEGQSNMAGRGETNGTWTETAMAVDDGAGWEFRAITDPTKLYTIDETVTPFGYAENNGNKINDGTSKTGGLVPAFINEYYKRTGVPVVGVSASQGGIELQYWAADAKRGKDAKKRWDAAVTWLTSNGYTIRHKYVLWCQGEADGDAGTTKQTYQVGFEAIVDSWIAAGAEKVFVIRIGEYNGNGSQDYSNIIDVQTEICQENKKVIMASTDYASMKVRGLMKDEFHYYQAGYNEIGAYAGINVGLYVVTGKEPTMYDAKNDNLYYSHKN